MDIWTSNWKIYICIQTWTTDESKYTYFWLDRWYYMQHLTCILQSSTWISVRLFFTLSYPILKKSANNFSYKTLHNSINIFFLLSCKIFTSYKIHVQKVALLKD
jgi:hypothetical protein